MNPHATPPPANTPPPSLPRVTLGQILILSLVLVIVLGVIAGIFKHEYKRAGMRARFSLRTPKTIGGAAPPVNLRALLKDNPKLYAEGQQVYAVNCAVCHGTDGYGNGPRAAGLNPPPRNYHTGTFLYGTSKLALYHTISNGIPGSAMPSFAMMPPEQRMAVIQYIRHWIPNPEHDTPAQLAALPAATAASGLAPLPKLKPVPEGPHVPIALAMQMIEQISKTGPAPAAGPAPAPVGQFALGAAIYQSRCAQCHGADGAGGIPTEFIWSHPWAEVEAASFRQPQMGLNWTTDPAVFAQLVTHGLAGRVMPGFGTLTQPEMTALYAYVEALAGVAAPAPAGSPPASGTHPPAAGNSAGSAPRSRGAH